MTDTTSQTAQTPTASPMTPPDLRSQLFGAQEWYADLVAAADDSHLHDRTPCDDFDVRALLTHMSTVFEKITGLAATGRDPFLDHDRSPEATDQAREDLARSVVDGVSAADRASALRAELGRAREAWTDEALDSDIALGWGPVMPGRIVAAIYLMEVLAHGSDLAAATHQDIEAPADVAQAGLAAAKMGLPEHPRGIEHGIPFGPVVPSSPDAGPTEQLANWTGRHTR